MPQLSIIVPVYKTEHYLPKCIDSILAQTFKDFELILIDDGSPDKCGRICDEYAEKDKRIKVLHQENAGVSAARNAGLAAATGEYLGFVDSDDWIEPEMYELMLNTMAEKSVDVVICGIQYFADRDEFIRKESFLQGEYTAEEMLFELYGTPNSISGSCCNKLFRRELVNSVRFNGSLTMAEDWIYLFNAFQNVRKGYRIPAALYSVVERPNSATRKNEVDALYNILFGGKLLLLLLLLGRSYSPELGKAAIYKYLDDCLRYACRIKEIGRETGKTYRKILWRIKKLMLKELIPAYLKRELSTKKCMCFPVRYYSTINIMKC